jgi:hypothetical protein
LCRLPAAVPIPSPTCNGKQSRMRERRTSGSESAAFGSRRTASRYVNLGGEARCRAPHPLRYLPRPRRTPAQHDAACFLVRAARPPRLIPEHASLLAITIRSMIRAPTNTADLRAVPSLIRMNGLYASEINARISWIWDSGFRSSSETRSKPEVGRSRRSARRSPGSRIRPARITRTASSRGNTAGLCSG